MITGNDFLKYIIKNYKSKTYIPVTFTAVCLVFAMKSNAACAELPEMYTGGQPPVYGEAGWQTYGWLEMNGYKYYLLPQTGQLARGWLEIEGITYYFLPQSGQMALGWLEIENNTYYFLPQTGQLALGWLEIDGITYYFLPQSGQMASGWMEIDGITYYFLPQSGQMASGWMEIEGITYYFLPQSGQTASGWMEIDGKSWYFLPESGQMASGWMEIDGESYYFLPESGQMALGCLELDEGICYFSPQTGEMLTGWQKTEMGMRYFSEETGWMAYGWQHIDGKWYYFDRDDGGLTTGSKKIGGEYYLFNEKGQLAKSKKTSLVHAGNQIYCADKSGKAASGWQMIGKKLYFASKTGKVKKNTVYRGITFGSSGAAKNNLNTRLKISAMKTFASITQKNMTKGQKLAACWSYVAEGGFRYAAKYPDLNTDGWQRKTAYDMLSTRSGNCYSFACAFAALAEEAGYQPYIICGRVRGSRDRMPDGYTRHAWVRINGKYYDPEAQYAGWRRGIYASTAYPVSHMVQNIVAF